uniref:PPM-type phosphatase domain-containing protein n=1 Tax=Pseudo-nitzschia australis TaxID=44445 RepID=A0A7S4AI21_9STRA
MLARWFDRSGIGQAMAPDPDARQVSENDEPRSQIWQILAPDERFAPTPTPPDGAFASRFGGVRDQSNHPYKNGGGDKKVQCVHCHNWTPVNCDATIETIVPASPAAPQTPKTPTNTNTNSNNDDDDLNARVLSACRHTSMFMKSPKFERQINDKFLRLCSSTQPLKARFIKKMRSMVTGNSFKDAYLLRVRATNMGVSAPDGYTSLQCAAYANNVAVAGLVLDLANEYASATGDTTTYADLHLDRELYGMTALHIAGERGNVEMIQFLLPLYEFPTSANPNDNNDNDNNSDGPSSLAYSSKPPPAANAATILSELVDLGGQTAFGRAMTSPNPKAKKNQRTLEKNLFSRNDLSIFGLVKSNEERMGSIAALGLHYGTADMPGLRGYMEDAMSVETWRQHTQQMALFAVCDGHGDNGRVSKFVASGVAGVLRQCMETHRERTMVPSTEYWNAVWHGVCLQLDRNLKEAFITEGGSTAVFALVTEQEIIVANVGDSRCILASKAKVKANENHQRRNDGDDDNNNNNNNNNGIESSNAAAQGEDASTVEAAPSNDGDKNNNNTNDSGNESEQPSDAPALVDESPVAAEVEEGTTTTATDEAAIAIAIALSEDHKPNLPDEATRIEKAGFAVGTIKIIEDDGTETFIHKVVKSEKDELAVSRAFGDFDYKCNDTLGVAEQAVVPIADVRVHTRNPETDVCLVLACDGIWDVMENQEVVDFVQNQVAIKSDTSPDSLLPDVADVLLHECLGRESRDNMSAILVSLRPINNNNTNIDNNAAASSSTLMPPKALDFGSAK